MITTLLITETLFTGNTVQWNYISHGDPVDRAMVDSLLGGQFDFGPETVKADVIVMDRLAIPMAA